jgi:hypothetical protein
MKDLFGQSEFGSPRGIDGIKIVSRCPLCQTEHNPLETSVLDEADGSHLFYIKCKKCNSGVVASVTPGNFGLTSIGVVTDLSGFEVKTAKDWGRVNADDVLSVVKYFQTHNQF